MAIDTFVWFAFLMIAISIVGAITGETQSTPTGSETYLTGTPATIALLLWLSLSIGYHTVLEWQFGKTLGKFLVKIEVTAADGSPLTLRASAVRNVLRLVDYLPLVYIIGIVLVVLSDRQQRLGDRVAKTVVVR